MSSLKTRSGKYIAAAMACVLTLTSMAGTDVQAAKKAKAKLAKTNIMVNVGKTKKIKLKKKLKKAKYTYASNKKKIATVSKKGKVKGVKVGVAKITVTEKVGKKKYKVGTVRVTVKGKSSTTTNPATTPTLDPSASAPAASVVPSEQVSAGPSSDTLSSAPPESEAPTASAPATKTNGPTKTNKPSTQRPPTPTPIVKPQTVVEEESRIETYSVDFAADVRVEESFSVTPTVESGNILKASFTNLTGFHLILPDTDDIKASKFKYVTITYKNTNSDLSLFLYDDGLDLGSPQFGENGPSKHERTIGLKKTGDTFETITVTLGDEYKVNFDVTKNSFHGLQIFDFGSETDLTINSIVFSAKEPTKPFDMSQLKEVEGKEEGKVVYDEATGEIKVADGVEMFRVPLPTSIVAEGQKLPENTMVSVTVKGRLSEESTGIRIWLCEGDPDATASDQYHYTLNNGVGFDGQGDGDVEFKTGEFTVKTILIVGGTGSKNFAADSLTIKGPKWGEMMSGVTITSIEARIVEP